MHVYQHITAASTAKILTMLAAVHTRTRQRRPRGPASAAWSGGRPGRRWPPCPAQQPGGGWAPAAWPHALGCHSQAHPRWTCERTSMLSSMCRVGRRMLGRRVGTWMHRGRCWPKQWAPGCRQGHCSFCLQQALHSEAGPTRCPGHRTGEALLVKLCLSAPLPAGAAHCLERLHAGAQS